MANPLKKLLVVVKFNDLSAQGLVAAIESLVNESKTNYPDRIFFVQNTGEIITHGVKFGASQELIDHVNTLETGFTSLAGISSANASLADAAITNDSLIGKYVAAHSADVAAADASVVVDSTSDATGTHYTVKVDTPAIVDGDTILAENGKLKSNLRFDFVHEDVDGEQHPFLVLKTADQTINGNLKKGTVIDRFDVNEFVVDGMLDEVKYDDTTNALIFTWNADGKKQSTSINITDILKLEAVHSTTEKYITATPNKNPHDTEGAKGACYDIAAVVSDTDLIGVSSLAKKDDDTYKSGVDTTSDMQVALGTVKEGLADANVVAAKFADADKKTADMANDIIGRLNALKTAIGAKDDEQDQKLTDHEARIAANEKAIETLNGDETVDGSVAKSIVDKLNEFKASLDSSAEYADAHGMVTVTTSIVDGEVDAATSKVVIKSDNLVVNTDADGEYLIGDVNYKAKGLDQIAANDPSLVTSKDAWVYGQCIKNQAIKEIASDNNEYIHITREDNKTKIVFEPWVEVHSIAELEKNLTY